MIMEGKFNMSDGFHPVGINNLENQKIAGQENTAYDHLYAEALDMRERAKELLIELTDKIDQISAWDIIQNLDSAINNGNIEQLKQVMEESSEILGYLEVM